MTIEPAETTVPSGGRVEAILKKLASFAGKVSQGAERASALPAALRERRESAQGDKAPNPLQMLWGRHHAGMVMDYTEPQEHPTNFSGDESSLLADGLKDIELNLPYELAAEPVRKSFDALFPTLAGDSCPLTQEQSAHAREQLDALFPQEKDELDKLFAGRLLDVMDAKNTLGAESEKYNGLPKKPGESMSVADQKYFAQLEFRVDKAQAHVVYAATDDLMRTSVYERLPGMKKLVVALQAFGVAEQRNFMGDYQKILERVIAAGKTRPIKE